MTFLPHRELGRTGFRATRLGIGDLAAVAIAHKGDVWWNPQPATT